MDEPEISWSKIVPFDIPIGEKHSTTKTNQQGLFLRCILRLTRQVSGRRGTGMEACLHESQTKTNIALHGKRVRETIDFYRIILAF